MEQILHNMDMLKYISKFLVNDEKKNIISLNKHINKYSYKICHDFVYDAKCLDILSNEYIYRCVRKIYNFKNTNIIQSDIKLWDNIHSVRCNRNITQNDIKLLSIKNMFRCMDVIILQMYQH